MKCPKCGSEMEVGSLYIPNRHIKHPIWLPNNERPSLIWNASKDIAEKNGEAIASHNSICISGIRLKTCICRKCKCGFIDYS